MSPDRRQDGERLAGLPRDWNCGYLVGFLPIALADKVKQLVASVRPSVRPSVRLFSLYLLNRLTSEFAFLCVCGT